MSKNDEAMNNDVIEGFEALRKDVAKLVEAMSQLTQRNVQAAEGHVADILDDTKNKVASAAAGAKTHALAATNEIEAGIERNPMTALLIAFGVGLAVAVVSRPRG